MHFVLARDLGPIPGALVKNIHQMLSAANALRDKGQFDQAIAAYEQIRDQNPKLTTVNLVVGDVYRKKAATENDPAARRALFDRAIASYTAVLTEDATHARHAHDIDCDARRHAHGSAKVRSRSSVSSIAASATATSPGLSA